jgi:hypothetical protein
MSAVRISTRSPYSALGIAAGGVAMTSGRSTGIAYSSSTRAFLAA